MLLKLHDKLISICIKTSNKIHALRNKLYILNCSVIKSNTISSGLLFSLLKKILKCAVVPQNVVKCRTQIQRFLTALKGRFIRQEKQLIEHTASIQYNNVTTKVVAYDS